MSEGRDDRGRFQMHLQGADRFWAKVDRCHADACWNWKGHKTSRGYGHFFHNGKTARAHRVAYELTHGAAPGALLICHSCDNASCCNPSHLWLGTDGDNMADKVRKGRCKTLPRPPLSAKDVREIRSLRGDVGQKILGWYYGVSQTTVSRLQLQK